MNQQDIGYTESLTLFVKDLGPTPQKIARKKLPLPNGHLVLLSDIFASSQSQNFQDNLHGHPSIMKGTGGNLHSWDADKREKGSLADGPMIHKTISP